MAAVTIVALTRADRDYKGAVTSSATGTATAGQVDIVYDDALTQEQLQRALEKALMFIQDTVNKR